MQVHDKEKRPAIIQHNRYIERKNYFCSIIKLMRRHLFWIAEVFIWVLILFSISGIILVTRYNYKKEFNTYQLFLPDVDGLINGSPVKMMGIQIGYVNQINIVGEDVYVKFIVTQKDVKLPAGAMATVEFSGLGGSKSLEIYPPDLNKKQTTGKLLLVEHPKRIHDSLGLLNDMFDQVVSITYKASYFMKQVGIIKTLNNNPSSKKPTQILEDTNNWIDRAQKQCDNLEKKITKDKQNVSSEGKTDDKK